VLDAEVVAVALSAMVALSRVAVYRLLGGGCQVLFRACASIACVYWGRVSRQREALAGGEVFVPVLSEDRIHTSDL
jgi:hypothetical protein